MIWCEDYDIAELVRKEEHLSATPNLFTGATKPEGWHDAFDKEPYLEPELTEFVMLYQRLSHLRGGGYNIDFSAIAWGAQKYGSHADWVIELLLEIDRKLISHRARKEEARRNKK